MWNNRVHCGSLGGPRVRKNNNGQLHHVGSYRKEKGEKKQGDFPVGFPRKVLSLVGHLTSYMQAENVINVDYEQRRGRWTQQHTRKFFIHALNGTKLVDYLKEENRKTKQKRGQQLTRFMRDLRSNSWRSREVLAIHYRTLYFTLLLYPTIPPITI